MNNKVVNNVAWIIGCRIIKVLLATFVSIFTARMLGPDNYGIINYASSMTNIISPFVLLGFNSILVHELINRYNNTDEGTILGTAVPAVWAAEAADNPHFHNKKGHPFGAVQ